jgi:phosphatidylserine/phosphatidylglycerophosphate/cardiolipin synthase-like enzyme
MDKASEGKDVRLFVTGPSSWWIGRILRPLSRTFYPDLLRKGVKIVELPGMWHSKALLADDRATIGTFNLMERSRKKIYELSLVAQNDPVFLTEVTSYFEDIEARGTRVTLDDVSGWGLRWLHAVRRTLALRW